ncbi:hypothetical protein [Teredinibacter sp. KSP-S5-2]|uniref:hypothetical protein n=1 Tax=Teredinibacter sp. KSP-S5-2 TaxID=3034506 RepID=UPI0029345AAF|nr:hypothetical protein [Teredinibacter sp. KSP-S5-2]WNO11419.1 hypothetical protein P5V12_09575 [Teredinibacter sp. KSP-S5-2]WNO11425.1 hypothetical protein P5V12_09605 [Teredinibacter sp. KSP-S5-2]
MVDQLVDQVDNDSLNQWLYEDGFQKLIEKAAKVCSMYPFVFDVNADGEPSDKALESVSHINELSSILSVIHVVQSQLKGL